MFVRVCMCVCMSLCVVEGVGCLGAGGYTWIGLRVGPFPACPDDSFFVACFIIASFFGFFST